MDIAFNAIFPAIILLIVLVSVGELILSAVWAPFYFRLGIPLLRRRYTLPADLDLAAQIPLLEQNLRRSWSRPAIVFRQLSPTEIAFRNNFGSRNPLQGLVRLEPGHGRMTISGHLYYSYFFFPLFILPILLGGAVPILFLLFFAAIFAFIFVTQYRHYAQIAGVIAATAGGQKAGETAVSFPDVNSQPGSHTTSEAWSTSAYDPFASAPSTPSTGFSKVEMVLLAILAVLLLAVLGFVFLMFWGG